MFGGWPLIIWEATTAKRNLSEITIEPLNSTTSRTTVSKKFGGGWARLGGCAPWPQRRTATEKKSSTQLRVNLPFELFSILKIVSIRSRHDAVVLDWKFCRLQGVWTIEWPKTARVEQHEVWEGF